MSASTPALPGRLSSIDAYRGLVMAPGSPFWAFLCFTQSHVE